MSMLKHGAFIGIALLATASSLLNWTRPLDLKMLDSQFGLLRAIAPSGTAPGVVIVGVDEDTVDQFPEPMVLWHRHLAQFLRAMVAAGPAAVGLDMVLPDRSFEAVLPGGDRDLVRAIIEARRAFPLVFALTIDSGGQRRAIQSSFAAAAGADGLGYALFPVDADGAVRRFSERLGEDHTDTPTLTGQMLRGLKIEPGSGSIDFTRAEPFDYIPLQRVLAWEATGDTAALQRAFAGKPVLLGLILPFTDRLKAPVALMKADAGSTNVPGVALHAQTLRSALGRGLIADVPVALSLLLGMAAAALWFVPLRPAYAVGTWFACAAGLLAASTWLLPAGWLLPVVTPVIAAALGCGGRSGQEVLRHVREMERVERRSKAARERIESELAVARALQFAMLPRPDHADAPRGRYELAAVLAPAKAVGGDLYDYFMLDSERLCLVVGDVSDKGVPAALFMVRVHTLLHALPAGVDTPDAMLDWLNPRLCRDNESCMFVTMVCGVLDLATGSLALASAGHDAPLLLRGAGGAVEPLAIDGGAALGVDEEAGYTSVRIELVPGDSLLLFTDGVTEAVDAGGRAAFGEAALADALRGSSGASRARADSVVAAVWRFAAGAEQFDDITVLMLRFRPDQAGAAA